MKNIILTLSAAVLISFCSYPSAMNGNFYPGESASFQKPEKPPTPPKPKKAPKAQKPPKPKEPKKPKEPHGPKSPPKPPWVK